MCIRDRLKGDEKSKEMYYWYARALEEKGDIPSALKAYSQVAQWDFNYRDVQGRIKRLRGTGGGAPSSTRRRTRPRTRPRRWTFRPAALSCPPFNRLENNDSGPFPLRQEARPPEHQG